MLAKLILIFILIPLVEVLLLLEVGRMIGFWATFTCIVITGILGAALARSQGLRLVWKLQDEIGKGIVPGKTLLEGIMILAAGLVLLTPGFITDIIGFSLLFPPIRNYLSDRIIKYFQSSRETLFGAGNFDFFKQRAPQTGEPGAGEVKSTWRTESDEDEN